MVNFGLSRTVANLRMLPECSPVVPRNVGFRFSGHEGDTDMEAQLEAQIVLTRSDGTIRASSVINSLF
ncbi:hypothetical protein SCLCIDRAFT_26580 [Scleroderma citrinum Foug A]|uniref:Uncharacterized protein n=1 Tax=Scleroderma citrinum Foug A TaxID=1036808 RepID=A0A0C3DWH8_9AGAM|nr:hypothetical protein SCLCIDRAFT_26580 [Scleroderma citrinum Foug A]